MIRKNFQYATNSLEYEGARNFFKLWIKNQLLEISKTKHLQRNFWVWLSLLSYKGAKEKYLNKIKVT